jgi:uncharacterized membrane protein
MVTTTSLARAALLGIGTGIRSMTPVALTARAASNGLLPLKGERPFDVLTRPHVADLLTVALIGEDVADKLPFTPKRTDPPGLAARIALGAWSGAILASSIARRGRTPAVVGASAAVGAAFAGMAVRARLSEHLPAVLVALGEDLLAASLAAEAVRIASGVPASG